MSASLITVVMPLYNNAPDLARSAGSVMEQTYQDFELLIINDGSTDGGGEDARRLHDRRVRVVDQENRGVSAARNRGVNEAAADVVAFLDADDEWKPDFLETIVRLRRSFPSCAIYGTHYLYREPDGKCRAPILRRVPEGSWEGIMENYFEAASVSDPPLWSSAVAVERQALRAVGGFPEGIAVGEDLLTWARLAAMHPVGYSKKQCAVFRLRAPLGGRPTRTPELPDRVGEELLRLREQVPARTQGEFRRYLAMWHRMRASMYLQLDDGPHAMQEVKKMAASSPSDPRVYLFGAMALSPKFMRKFVLQFFTLVRTFRRNFRK